MVGNVILQLSLYYASTHYFSIQKLPSWLRNRYAITLICFFIYMLFFDRHDLISQWHLKQELGKLEENKEY